MSAAGSGVGAGMVSFPDPSERVWARDWAGIDPLHLRHFSMAFLYTKTCSAILVYHYRGGWPLHTSRVIITFPSCDSRRLLKVIANSCTNRRPFLGLLWSAPSWQSSNTLCKWTRRPLASTLVLQGRRLRRAWGPSGPGDYFHSFLPYLS